MYGLRCHGENCCFVVAGSGQPAIACTWVVSHGTGAGRVRLEPLRLLLYVRKQGDGRGRTNSGEVSLDDSCDLGEF